MKAVANPAPDEGEPHRTGTHQADALLEVPGLDVVLVAFRVEAARVLEVHAQVVPGVPDALLEAVVQVVEPSIDHVHEGLVVQVLVEFVHHLLVQTLEARVDVLLDLVLVLHRVLEELLCLLGEVQDHVVLAVLVLVTLQFEVGDVVVDPLLVREVLEVVVVPILVVVPVVCGRRPPPTPLR